MAAVQFGFCLPIFASPGINLFRTPSYSELDARMSATMRIDAHHHFWKYDPVEYDWIDNKMSVIRRDFLPQDLRAAMDTADVDGVVSVQARQSLEETRWLLELAQQHDFIRGVVGWVPLVSPRVGEEIERFAANPKLRAVRHVLQGRGAR